MYWSRLRPLPGARRLLRACHDQGLRVALDHAEAGPDESVFIGDAVWDARAAQQAGVPCIGLLSGGSGRDELTGAGAAAFYEGPADLLEEFPARLADSR